jgi:IS5 family transposase
MLWRRLASEVIPADDRLHIVDSLPLPVCRFARASFCQRFRGSARYGKDHADRQTFYGFRLHARLTWPGLLSEVFLAPANASEQSVLVPLAHSAPPQCALVGDRNYCVGWLKERLAADSQYLLTPPARQARQDPLPMRGKKWAYSNLRYRTETVFGQLTDRFHIKRIWAKDLWHLTGRIYRKVLAHTVTLMLNMEQGNPPLQFDRLLNA